MDENISFGKVDGAIVSVGNANNSCSSLLETFHDV